MEFSQNFMILRFKKKIILRFIISLTYLLLKFLTTDYIGLSRFSEIMCGIDFP
jgi:hypothetical protein